MWQRPHQVCHIVENAFGTLGIRGEQSFLPTCKVGCDACPAWGWGRRSCGSVIWGDMGQDRAEERKTTGFSLSPRTWRGQRVEAAIPNPHLLLVTELWDSWQSSLCDMSLPQGNSAPLRTPWYCPGSRWWHWARKKQGPEAVPGRAEGHGGYDLPTSFSSCRSLFNNKVSTD